MCLLVKKPKLNLIQRIFRNNEWKKPLIAKEDIHCFKYYKTKTDSHIVDTIYQNMTYDLRKPLPQVTLGINSYYRNEINIYEGYHSFKDISTKEAGTQFHAIIPKGSLYFLGRFEYENDSYVSNNLIIGEKVKK